MDQKVLEDLTGTFHKAMIAACPGLLGRFVSMRAAPRPGPTTTCHVRDATAPQPFAALPRSHGCRPGRVLEARALYNRPQHSLAPATAVPGECWKHETRDRVLSIGRDPGYAHCRGRSGKASAGRVERRGEGTKSLPSPRPLRRRGHPLNLHVHLRGEGRGTPHLAGRG
jgi:hypothetical protein